jgi:chemotaxis protein MotB
MSEESDPGRRDQDHEEPENHERWLVSYADFITLLFAFFVVMYATSSNNQEKQKSFQDSVKTSLKLVVSGGDGDGSGGGAAEGNVGGTDAGDSFVSLEGFPSRGGPAEAKEFLNREIDKKLESSDKEKIQELRHDAIGVRIELASSQFFLPGGIKLKISALKTLDKIAAILKMTDKKIVIEGHTDNLPVVNDAAFESNWELASLRATSIVRYFIRYHQIDEKRLSAISYADTRPVADNTTNEGRARNRRIEIYLILDEKLQNY